jgi:hypothetical protein
MFYCTYLFQENKSFGSKKPFAFILWCTRSCVEHSNYVYINIVITSFHEITKFLAFCESRNKTRYPI